MDWLSHNSIADMVGPTFLLFYAVVIAITLIVSRRAVRRCDTSLDRPIPPLPESPDPYEIAYLRGGQNEVVRLAVFRLLQQGWLETTDHKTASARELRTAPQGVAPSSLTPIEREVYRHCQVQSRKPGDLFNVALGVRIELLCTRYRQRLESERLLVTPDLLAERTRILRIGLGVILGVGGYKLVAALNNGHHNVLFLILMGVIASCILASFGGAGRITNAGREYLKRLQQAFGRFRTPAGVDAAESATVDPTLLGVGLFGVAVLANTAYGYYPQMFQKATGAAGGGCGSSSGGCGSSSCGGGSGCGGGGCGGCGGGS